jgi:hypothetical protein
VKSDHNYTGCACGISRMCLSARRARGSVAGTFLLRTTSDMRVTGVLGTRSVSLLTLPDLHSIAYPIFLCCSQSGAKSRVHHADRVLGRMWCGGDRGGDIMAGLVDPIRLPDLTPVAQDVVPPGGAPLLVYTSQTAIAHRGIGSRRSILSSYIPSDGGSPRLVAMILPAPCLGVWDTGSGEFLQALQASHGEQAFISFIAYQQPSDGRPRVAAALRHQLCIWDGDDFQVLRTISVESCRQGSHAGVRGASKRADKASRRVSLIQRLPSSGFP